MKSKLILITLFLLTFSITSFAQVNLSISTKKVTYQRPGKEVPKHKKTFDVSYPVITGKGPLVAKVKESISYWKNFDTNLEEEKRNTYTSDYYFEVNFLGAGILDITLFHEGSGAYPSTFVKNLVIDLTTGESLKINKAFVKRNLLYQMIADAHQKEIDKSIAEDKEDILKQLIKESAEFRSIYEIQDFRIMEKGIEFIYDYEFSHATLALEPEGRYFFSWEQLKPFIDEYGTLARINK